MRQRLRDSVLISAAVLSLSAPLASFPLRNILADEPCREEKRLVFIPSSYMLAVSLDGCGYASNGSGCLTGLPISLKVTDSDGKNVNGQEINVLYPSGKKSSIYTKDAPVDFVPTEAGQYTFEYNGKKFVVFVSAKEEKGTLKLSTNSCKAGETIWIDTVDAKGNQITGGIVKVVLPDKSESEVHISNELDGFIPAYAGHYTFIYGNQMKTVCVNPSSHNVNIAAITPEEASKRSPDIFYLSLEPSNIHVIGVGVTAFYGFCFDEISCKSLISINLPDVTASQSTFLAGAMASKTSFMIISHGGAVSLIDLLPVTKLATELNAYPPTQESMTRLVPISLNTKQVSFNLFPLDKNGQPRDGGLVVKITFSLNSNTGSIQDVLFIHDDSVCPLKQK